MWNQYKIWRALWTSLDLMIRYFTYQNVKNLLVDENQRIFYLLLKFLCVKFETCKFVGFSEKTENCPRSNMWSKLVTSARICPWWGQPTECWGQGWWFRGITVSRFLKVTGKYPKICFTITVKHSCSEVPKTSGFELWYHNSFIR